MDIISTKKASLNTCKFNIVPKPTKFRTSKVACSDLTLSEDILDEINVDEKIVLMYAEPEFAYKTLPLSATVPGNRRMPVEVISLLTFKLLDTEILDADKFLATTKFVPTITPFATFSEDSPEPRTVTVPAIIALPDGVPIVPRKKLFASDKLF